MRLGQETDAERLGADHAYDVGVAKLYPRPGDMNAFIAERMYFPMNDGAV